MVKKDHKPIIETMINTSALALSGMGVINVQKGDYLGLVLIAFAAGIEYFKYYGRSKELW